LRPGSIQAQKNPFSALMFATNIPPGSQLHVYVNSAFNVRQ
jgi:hypothetical protein